MVHISTIEITDADIFKIQKGRPMAYIDSRSAIVSARPLGVLSFIAAGLSAWRQRRALNRLDAAARADLGLSCADIAREAARPLWDVPQSWRY
jgi:uncharacterized protein YjiS (DUF1127 family)